MIKKIELIMIANVPDNNGIVYTEEIMKCIVDRLNQPKFVPIVVGINPDEYNNPPVGRVIQQTALFDGKKIYVDVDIEEHVLHLLDSSTHVVGTYLVASLNEDNEVIPYPKFDIIELQIIKIKKGQ